MRQIRRAKGWSVMASPVRMKNRLAAEKSPYLQQHATNPVDWYPWGEEAFEKAKKENKPIFLSVGYSTCHWCHVMERESFESEKIGALLNEHFVSIKVDREERPDVDKIYMTFIQAISGGGGGWPMSVWLTPELKPFFGGTYFPPTSVYHRPGFGAVLTDIARQWKEKQGKITDQSAAIASALQENTAMPTPEGAELPSRDCIHQSFRQLHKRFDAEHGGFSSSPKFPQPTTFNFLFRVYAMDPSSGQGTRSLEISLFTLKAMARGGIHDHVAQGFHRYSTDKYWHVPHFEKMLYDQAQLCVAYVDAYQITGEQLFADVARDILTYVSRDLSDEDGGFYSAEDADSYPNAGDAHKREGAFCVWTADEIRSLLTDTVKQPEGASMPLTTSDVFCEYYGVKRKGNVSPDQDPHKELTGKNVLIVRHSVSELAEKFNISEDKVSQCLYDGRRKLFEERKKRPKPHRDNKIITAWNGLMISGFARAAQALGDVSYLERAEKAARHVQSQLFDGKTLKRNSYRDPEINQLSVGKVDGFADDYAFLIRALLDLYEASFNEEWIKWAVELQSIQNRLFWDDVNSGYYGAASGDNSLLMRMKEDHDGAEPSANSVSAYNLMKLAALVERREWREKAEKIFVLFSDRMERVGGLAVPEMVGAYTLYLHTPAQQIIIAGDPNHDDTKSMLKCVHSTFLPNKILIVQDDSPGSYLKTHLQSLQPLKSLDGKATAYVCKDFTCSLPTTDVCELRQQLSS